MNKLALQADGLSRSPVENLLCYLNGRLPLSPVFNEGIFPMLGAVEISKRYKCCGSGEVLETAYWLDSGYGYGVKDGVDKEDLPVKHIVEIYGPGRIMLDADGFFNNKRSDCEIYICKNSVMVPFSRSDFGQLKLIAPESEALANCILAEDIKHNKEKMNMQKLKGIFKYDRFLEIFGREVLQYFSQKQIADYFGFTEVHFSNMKNRAFRRGST